MEFFHLSKGNQRKNNWKTDTELWETFQKKRGTRVREVWCYLHEEYSLAAKKKFCILIFCSRSILLGRNKFLLPDFRHADLMRCISHKGRILQQKSKQTTLQIIKSIFFPHTSKWSHFKYTFLWQLLVLVYLMTRISNPGRCSARLRSWTIIPIPICTDLE